MIALMTVGTTIRKYRQAKGMTIMELANQVDSDVGNISRLERGKQGWTEPLLKRIAGALGMEMADFFKEDGNVEEVKPRGQVPLISWVQAGAWCEATDIYNVGDAETWLSCPVKHGPRTYALRVRGESMYNPGERPSFADGDVIFVDPDRQAQHKSLVVLRLADSHEATFKRLLTDGEQRFLEALNPSWPNRIVQINSNTHICGVVIARLESFI